MIIVPKLLEEYGYRQSDKNPGFWKQDTRPIYFTLTADDFGVKCIGKEHADHFIKVLEEHYTVAKD